MRFCSLCTSIRNLCQCEGGKETLLYAFENWMTSSGLDQSQIKTMLDSIDSRSGPKRRVEETAAFENPILLRFLLEWMMIKVMSVHAPK